MTSESSLSSVMRKLVRAVMVFICAAAGYQVSKVMLEENWWPSVTLLHPIATTILIIIFFCLPWLYYRSSFLVWT